MKRLFLIALIMPLPWPWLSSAIAMWMFRVGTDIDARYNFWTAPLWNPHLFVEAYALMLLCLPMMVLMVKAGRFRWWSFALLGTIVGLVATILYYLLPLLFFSSQPDPGTAFYSLLSLYGHQLVGNSLATLVMTVLVWLLAVRLSGGYVATKATESMADTGKGY